MIILMGCTLYPYYYLGELWEIPNENDIEHRGGQPFFSWKREYAIGCKGLWMQRRRTLYVTCSTSDDKRCMIYTAWVKSLSFMTGWLTVSKALDWSKNTGPFNLRFSIFGRIFSASTSPICSSFPTVHLWVFMHEGCERVRVAVLFQGDLKGLPWHWETDNKSMIVCPAWWL